MKVEALEEKTKKLLRKKGYAVVSFVDLSHLEKRTRLQKLFLNAQSYMDQRKAPKDLPQGKIAVPISKSAWEQLQKDKQTFDLWKANRAYTTLYE